MTTMYGDGDFDWRTIGPVTPEDIGAEPSAREFITEPVGPEVEPPAPEYDEPNPKFIDGQKQTPRSKAYEKKTRGVLNKGMRVAFAHPATVPDAATLIMYGPNFSRAVGEAADKEPKVRAVVDFITEGSDNPYANMIAAGFPLIAQLIRNHEPQLEPTMRGIRIPFTKKRLRLKFGIKLGRLRNMTDEPDEVVKYVLSDPEIIGALKDAGIGIAYRQ